ncbi:hypothetical protein GGTG_13539 [Gaeumannomyces tritici R3-111a-1]|uniref:Uncharacterized protein n=1 Tax=Gaeumannomyces tritici (strain R3-111a-1) TaxID=644352 RepID=J3PJ57_GAET3|nr:hypothetical protein GGTG_13539 [Gaeumannomyces tritici R3-111a-1]EJT68875.1 hypothetical protein GGTG_13539 [Gaeumannomyces tritici R3-111a-1]
MAAGQLNQALDAHLPERASTASAKEPSHCMAPTMRRPVPFDPRKHKLLEDRGMGSGPPSVSWPYEARLTLAQSDSSPSTVLAAAAAPAAAQLVLRRTHVRAGVLGVIYDQSARCFSPLPKYEDADIDTRPPPAKLALDDDEILPDADATGIASVGNAPSEWQSPEPPAMETSPTCEPFDSNETQSKNKGWRGG